MGQRNLLFLCLVVLPISVTVSSEIEKEKDFSALDWEARDGCWKWLTEIERLTCTYHGASSCTIKSFTTANKTACCLMQDVTDRNKCGPGHDYCKMRDGTLQYSEVITLLQKEPNVTSIYKSIAVSGNSTISLSGSHLIFARKSDADKFGSIYSDEIEIGDELLLRVKELMPTKVLHMASFTYNGIYDPLTIDGNIVVDGVLASCYASFDHDLAQLVMTPVQWFPGMIQWIFGEDNGSLSYAIIVKELGRMILSSDLLL